MNEIAKKNVDGWVYAALCNWANKEGSIQCVKVGNQITLKRRGETIGVVLVEKVV